MRKTEDEPEVPAVIAEKPFVSDVVVLFAAGPLLVAAGTGLELLL